MTQYFDAVTLYIQWTTTKMIRSNIVKR